MSDILRDPMWQFIAVLLAIVGIIITYVLYRKEHKNKTLAYEILSNTPLLSMEEEVKGKLQIMFLGQVIQQVHLVAVKIINSGNVPIVTSDYERRVSINLGDKAQIFTSEIVETNPKNLQVTFGKVTEGSTEKIVLEPTLLNQGDYFTVKMLAGEFGGKISVDGRIVGVKEIKEFSEYPTWLLVLTLCGFVMIILGQIGILLIPQHEPFWWIAVALWILGFPSYVIPILKSKFFRRILRKLSEIQ